MIVTCPECAARYQTDPVAIGPEGRKVKCSNCGHSWLEMAPVVADPGGAVAATPADAASATVAATTHKGGWTSTGVGWAVFLFLVGLIGSVGYLSRDTIVEKFPQTEKLYALIGLSPPQSGLEILRPYIERGERDGKRTLTVHAELVNVTNREVPVPPVRVTLKDAANNPVLTRSKKPGVLNLLPGATTSIQTTIPNPPLEAVDLEIEIVNQAR